MAIESFNCELGRKKTLHVELTLTEIMLIIWALEFVGRNNIAGQFFCDQCQSDMLHTHGTLTTMADIATGGELSRKRG